MADFIPSDQFQTPQVVAKYMARLIPLTTNTILEPTPGIGMLVAELRQRGPVYAPNRYEDIPAGYRCGYCAMNPPFTPMAEGFRYLQGVMGMCDHIVALLPWFIIINSERRLKIIQDFGLEQVISIPRKTFPGPRIQCCILVLKKGYADDTLFKSFTW